MKLSSGSNCMSYVSQKSSAVLSGLKYWACRKCICTRHRKEAFECRKRGKGAGRRGEKEWQRELEMGRHAR